MHPAWRNLFRRCAVYHRMDAVETAAVIGAHTNSLTITRTQLTGLSDSCRRHEKESNYNGIQQA